MVWVGTGDFRGKYARRGWARRGGGADSRLQMFGEGNPPAGGGVCSEPKSIMKSNGIKRVRGTRLVRLRGGRPPDPPCRWISKHIIRFAGCKERSRHGTAAPASAASGKLLCSQRRHLCSARAGPLSRAT